MTHIAFFVNGKPVSVECDPATPLLDVLRDELGLTGTKQGCDHEGECGACTILLDGRPVRSCLTPVGKVTGRSVETVEGLGEPDNLHPLQSSFIEVGAVQCGYCTPGMLMAAKGLLDHHPNPSREQIVEALEGNLCRCTGYHRIVQAVEVAAARLRGNEVRITFTSDKLVIGGNVLRSDSIDKVTGRALYVEDIKMEGLLHAKILRSPHHHARLIALDTERAALVPGVVRIFTAQDISGNLYFPAYSQNEPILAPVGTTVRTNGAPVAAVVAETQASAEQGIAAIDVIYEVLPHTFEVEDTLKPDAEEIDGDHNLLYTYTIKHGNLAAAFEEADRFLETTYHTTFIEHAALERETLLGYIGKDSRLTIIGGSHQPHLQQGYVSDVLGIPRDQIRVIIPPTGGTFGGKQDPWPFLITGTIVYHLRRPVRLVYGRQESFIASPKRHPYTVRYKMGVTYKGKLSGIHVRIDCNTGGYDSHGQYINNYALTASGGPYRWIAVDGLARTVFTNGPKSGQFRGFGTSQSTFALECAIDELVQSLDIDPIEFRIANSINEGDISFLGYPIGDTIGYVNALKAIQPYYEAFSHQAEVFNREHAQGRLRQGVGLAGMWYRFGKSGKLNIEAHTELAPDGHLIVYCSAPDYGQGTNTVMSQMAAEAFGVTRDRVELVNADTALVPDSDIQGASRATFFVGGAVVEAVSGLKEEILGVAAELLDVPPGRLAIQADRVLVMDDPTVALPLCQVADEFDRLGKSRRVARFFDLRDEFPEATRPQYIPLFVTGAHLSLVEV
ncbi:MAG: molybdopterin-dependent oxidoreductase, partial [Anaerolineales bacterium]|nr:molybdopterin-dependent oxidoreductase [Anaerolineales bacterium]